MDKMTELNIGVFHTTETNPEKLADPATKHYTSQIPGLTIVCGDGSELQFIGGVFSTSNPYLINILDRKVDMRLHISSGRSDIATPSFLQTAAEDNATLSKVAVASDSGARANEDDITKAKAIALAAG